MERLLGHLVALRDQTKLNIRERAGRRKQKPHFPERNLRSPFCAAPRSPVLRAYPTRARNPTSLRISDLHPTAHRGLILQILFAEPSL